jgi:hypothetical protein
LPLPGGLVPGPVTTPVDGWTTLDGRPFPGATRATWHLPDGPFTYVEGAFVPSSTTFDAWPGTAGVPATAALAAAPGP